MHLIIIGNSCAFLFVVLAGTTDIFFFFFSSSFPLFVHLVELLGQCSLLYVIVFGSSWTSGTECNMWSFSRRNALLFFSPCLSFFLFFFKFPFCRSCAWNFVADPCFVIQLTVLPAVAACFCEMSAHLPARSGSFTQKLALPHLLVSGLFWVLPLPSLSWV